MSEDDDNNRGTKPRLCRECQKKDPPQETPFFIDQDITRRRLDKGNYICNGCLKQQNADYRAGTKEKYAEYLSHLHHETVDELATQWEDPAYRKLRIAERVYRIWDKYNRRDPSTGVKKHWVLEVIMPELWNIDTGGILNDHFSKMNYSRSQRIAAKPYLNQFIFNNLEFLQLRYRKLAENKWDGIVQWIIKEHVGRDKMIAQPAHMDPVTKESVDNWFLLSREQEQRWRQEKRLDTMSRMEIITQEEKRIVDLHTIEIEKEPLLR